MSTMQPISDKHDLKKASKFIKQNFDGAYSLIFQVAIETGYRITDVTELRYENIDFDNQTITIKENKGSRANQARARLKVLEAVKLELIGRYSDDSRRMMGIFVLKAKDIYAVIPDSLKPLVDIRIKEAMAKAKPKVRTTKLSHQTLIKIQARAKKFNLVDEGFLFARTTLLNSNRARNTEGVISRQSCFKVFSQLNGFMATLGKKVKVACHGLRKTFAKSLYTSSGNNIGLLMKTIGHSSVSQSLRYIGIDDTEQMDAVGVMFEYMEAA